MELKVIDFILESRKQYEEKLIELTEIRKENIGEIKKVEKARKFADKMGVTALIEGNNSLTETELQEVEKSIKMCKAVITRLDTVIKMFNDNEEVIINDTEVGEIVEL